jgi:hypothetical protein
VHQSCGQGIEWKSKRVMSESRSCHVIGNRKQLNESNFKGFLFGSILTSPKSLLLAADTRLLGQSKTKKQTTKQDTRNLER